MSSFNAILYFKYNQLLQNLISSLMKSSDACERAKTDFQATLKLCLTSGLKGIKAKSLSSKLQTPSIPKAIPRPASTQAAAAALIKRSNYI